MDSSSQQKIEVEQVLANLSALVGKIVNQKARKYRSERKDMEQSVWADIIEALPEFDRSKGSLSTFVYWQALGAATRWLSKRECGMSRQTMEMAHDFKYDWIRDPYQSEHDEPESTRIIDFTVEEVVDGIKNKQEQDIARLMLIEGMTIRDVSEQLGIPYTKADNAWQYIRRKMRKTLARYNHAEVAA